MNAFSHLKFINYLRSYNQNELQILFYFIYLFSFYNLQGKVAFVSADGIHQLHIFIFVLAIFHVFYCITTLALGRAKVLLLN